MSYEYRHQGVYLLMCGCVIEKIPDPSSDWRPRWQFRMDRIVECWKCQPSSDRMLTSSEKS